jgi:hypothetical protein
MKIYAIIDFSGGAPGDAPYYFSIWSIRDLAELELLRLDEPGLEIVEIELDRPDNAP